MQVHVRDEGPKDDPAPLVLVHGTGSSLHIWQAWADALKSTRRVISLDRPGFGLTGPNPSGDYSTDYSTDFLRRLLDELGVQRAVLVGNSSGGLVAWHFAVRFPERVDRLVLIGSAGYPSATPLSTGFRLAMLPVLGPLLLHFSSRPLVAKSTQRLYGDPAKITPDVIDRYYELTLRAGNRNALGAALRQARDTADPALIPKIAVPTLILWGTEDHVVSPKDAQRFHADILGSTLRMLPGLGHIPQEEDPAATFAALEQFLCD